jgi:hypothetical protein
MNHFYSIFYHHWFNIKISMHPYLHFSSWWLCSMLSLRAVGNIHLISGIVIKFCNILWIIVKYRSSLLLFIIDKQWKRKQKMLFWGRCVGLMHRWQYRWFSGDIHVLLVFLLLILLTAHTTIGMLCTIMYQGCLTLRYIQWKIWWNLYHSFLQHKTQMT